MTKATHVRASTPTYVQTKKLEVAGVDPGNRFIKYASAPDTVGILPSIAAKLEDWDAQQSPNTSDSASFTYEDGAAIDLIGNRYVVGSEARYLQGKHTFYGEKATVAPLLILAAIAKMTIAHRVEIDRLISCLPEDRDGLQSQAIREALVGNHILKLGDDQLAIDISQIRIEPEGYRAFRWLATQGTFDLTKLSGVIDVGGGNVGISLFTPTGSLIRESHRILPGVAFVAAKIAKHPLLIGCEGKHCSPKQERILDAIADGGFKYGTTGKNFHTVFVEERQRWEEDLRQQIRTAWQDHFPDIGKIAIVGGAASWLQPLVDKSGGRFLIPTHPETATVRGMVS